MAVPRMKADVGLSVQGIQAIIGTIDVPFTMRPGQATESSVPVTVRLDKAGLGANIAGLLRAVADEFENGEWAEA